MAEMWKENEEPKLFLRLFQEDGAVVLRIVDDRGNCICAGDVLSVRSDGTLYKNTDIHPQAAKRAGIRLDARQRIVVAGVLADDD